MALNMKGQLILILKSPPHRHMDQCLTNFTNNLTLNSLS